KWSKHVFDMPEPIYNQHKKTLIYAYERHKVRINPQGEDAKI
ncbi:20396_t:CDS:1, partial [Entrophospora sp. SA101]